MGQLNERIKTLEKELSKVKSKIQNMSKDLEAKPLNPYSKGGFAKDQALSRPIDAKSGWGSRFGGSIIWNDVVLNNFPGYGQAPSTEEPTEAYNLHSHSRYEGGALDIDALELIKYSASPYNKYLRGYWPDDPAIEKDENGNPKIGHLAIEWDPSAIDPITGKEGMWKAGGTTVIDVKKTLFVEYDEDPDSPTYGQIIHQSTLWNEDETKSNVVWDEDAEVFRFLAVYAD